MITDETNASLNCIYIQLPSLHPSKDSYVVGSSDFTREGSVARIVSPEYEQSLSIDGQLRKKN